MTSSTLPPRSSDLDTAFDFIREFASQRHYGIIQLSFQAGNLVNVRQDQSIKPADLSTLIANSKGVSNGARNSQ